MPARKAGGYRRKGVLYSGPTMPKLIKKAQTKQITKIAKKVVEKQAEVKECWNLTVMDKVNVPGAGLRSTAGYGQWAACIPLLSQGTTENTRVGNVVNVKSMSIRYTLKALPTTVTGGSNPYNGVPFMVRVVVYRHKYNIGDSSPDNIIDVNNSSTYLGSDLDGYFRKYNKDEYMIAYSKTHRMSAPSHNNGSTTDPSNQDPKSTAVIIKTANIKLPSKLYFNDALNTPTNAGWYIGIAVVNTDEAAIPATTAVRCTANVESYLRYTD